MKDDKEATKPPFSCMGLSFRSLSDVELLGVLVAEDSLAGRLRTGSVSLDDELSISSAADKFLSADASRCVSSEDVAEVLAGTTVAKKSTNFYGEI